MSDRDELVETVEKKLDESYGSLIGGNHLEAEEIADVILGWREKEKKVIFKEGWDACLNGYCKKALEEKMEEILGGLPPRQTHYLEHGDVGHPTETPEDSAYNRALEDCEQAIRGMFK